ncbi:putative Zn-dependent peptidase [Treponema sp. JC4]|uniref:M16 family metallopeptidase n=1 Tax=Treponema sp. JC4 TaxID=1124982 RepID=UPI00025AFDB9|nr:insulinase family protein [Treponema sp. JC4]EID84307.1 putative Zn-dependent peptidase [Treponema sp. JC4]
MKKTFFALAALLFCFNAEKLSAAPETQIKQYVLENGMNLFLLEDTSDALVHIELSVKAGFSSQTQRTNGFFKLYTNLIKAQFPNLDKALCNSDSSNYAITVTGSETEDTLLRLSETALALQYTDEELAKQINLLKTESDENAKSMAGFINSAIDSKVFSAAPWQHDSGIYPQIFNKTSQKEARLILQSIGQKWYTPKNSALFISGNFNSEKLLSQVKNSFGRFFSASFPPAVKSGLPVNTKKRFVLHNEEFSADLTQVVIQYTNFSKDDSELASAAMNLPSSGLKTALLEEAKLNIPGDEYIHIAAAHKKDTSRVIIQSLLQKPADPKAKITGCAQTLKFLDILKASKITADEVNFAKQQLFFEFENIKSNPKAFMQQLCEYWGIWQYQKLNQTPDSNVSITLTEDFLSQPALLSKITSEALQADFANNGEPFVFVIVNSDEYKKAKAEYKAAGFEEITIKNASWYSQQMFKEIKDLFKPDEEVDFASSKGSPDNDYYLRNKNQIESQTLNNGISLTTKKSTSSTDIALLLSIKGGELNTSQNHGFEEAVISIIAGMIQKEVRQKQADGIVLGSVSITPKTYTGTSSVLISCIPQDFNAVCQSISKAMIYDEIPPALADRAVSSRRYKKRLENGSAPRQLYTAVINAIFGKSAMLSINNTTDDILMSTDYKAILQAYPDFLDATRYDLIITGNFNDDNIACLKKEFELFAPKKKPFAVKKLQQRFPDKKTVYVKINHTFLTDIPAEKAGPMPAVLIPTTEFLDPVIFGFKAPAAGTREAAIFNALLNYLEDQVQAELITKSKTYENKCSVQFPLYNLDAGFILIQNVRQLREAEEALKTAIQSLNARLISQTANSSVLPQIKNLWTKKQLESTASNQGTALLMQEGIELFPDAEKPAWYLEQYNIIQTAGPQDFIDAMQYFPASPALKVISKDTKN